MATKIVKDPLIDVLNDVLWDVPKIAAFLGKPEAWVYRCARKYGLDLFDIGGGNLRARRTEVLRWAYRNSRDPKTAVIETLTGVQSPR
jgi:hypothetical protein